MRIILTDVTHMFGDRICTAGWSEEEQRMIRPLLPGGIHWTTAYATPTYLEVGNVLEFQPANNNRIGTYPHATEDYSLLNDRAYIIEKISNDRIIDRIGGLSTSPETVFTGNLQNRRFVNPGVRCPSLGAIDIPSDDINFTVSYGKLRAMFVCQRRQYEGIPVTGVFLRGMWQEQGLNALNQLKLRKTRAYIRLGLARAFVRDGQQHPCYMMVNNVLFH